MRLNPDDWFECPECRLVAQLLYEPNAVNAINHLAWSGTVGVKGERAFDHLFEDLLVIYKHSNGTIVALDSDEEVIELKKTIDAGSDEKQ